MNYPRILQQLGVIVMAVVVFSNLRHHPDDAVAFIAVAMFAHMMLEEGDRK